MFYLLEGDYRLGWRVEGGGSGLGAKAVGLPAASSPDICFESQAKLSYSQESYWRAL